MAPRLMICSACPATNFRSVFSFFVCAATSSRALPSCPGSLQTSKEDLLQADFEGALKFFRVQLPKRYRAAENARRLMEQACNIKVRRSDPPLARLLVLSLLQCGECVARAALLHPD